MKLYIIRHAQALSNIGKATTPNSDLSDLGKKQAALIPTFFQDINIDAIYSSPFRRAMQTAESLARGKKIPITMVPNMCEIFNEDWTDYRDHSWETRQVILAEFTGASFIETAKQDKWWPDWPESSDMVFDRVKNFYDTHLSTYFQTDKHIVVFGHGHTTDDLKKAVCPTREYPAPNAGIFEYEIDGSGKCLDSRMILDHLGDMITY